jgi:hypothetical protein
VISAEVEEVGDRVVDGQEALEALLQSLTGGG